MPSNLTCLPFSDHTRANGGRYNNQTLSVVFRKPTGLLRPLGISSCVDEVPSNPLLTRASSHAHRQPRVPCILHRLGIRDAASVVGRLTTQTSPPSSKQAQALASPTPWTHPESRHCPPLPHRLRQIAPQGTRGWRPRVLCLPYRSLKLPLYTVELSA
nr:related to latency associated protein [imported] - Neurospora crassa [Neurospora crassa]